MCLALWPAAPDAGTPASPLAAVYCIHLLAYPVHPQAKGSLCSGKCNSPNQGENAGSMAKAGNL